MTDLFLTQDALQLQISEVSRRLSVLRMRRVVGGVGVPVGLVLLVSDGRT
jgi:hypothetical protein